MKDALIALFASASKIVFLMIAATVCYGFTSSKLDPKDFMVLAGMVFVYYFNKPAGTQPTSEADQTRSVPLPPTTVETHITSTAPATVPGVK